ncbi:MAG: hypothetical protein ABIN55_00895, partial [Aeromicrobium sp.]
VVVAITGFAGAGKSTLTRTLVEAVPDSTRLRGDDFLDPTRSHLRSGDWDGVERSRMRTEVIEPFGLGGPVSYRPFDWSKRELGPPVRLPDVSVLIVDAIGLLHPELDGCFDLTVWVDVELEVAAVQGRERDRRAGRDHDTLWDEVWVPNDRDFAAAYEPASNVDLKISPGLGHGERLRG